MYWPDFNLAFTYATETDQWVHEMYLTNDTTRRDVMNKIANWSQNYQYPWIFISQGKRGVVLWDDWQINLNRGILYEYFRLNPLPLGDFYLNNDGDEPDTDGAFNLTWTASTNANDYSIYSYQSYITHINDSLTLLVNQSAISPFSVSGLLNGTYYYMVVAHNEFGVKLSNCTSVTVAIPPNRSPSAFSLSSNADTPDTDGSFHLTWTTSTNADNYSIYISNQFISEIDSNSTLIAQVFISPYLIQELGSGAYYYIIVARNTYGETLSNCIIIYVEISELEEILGYDALSLIFMVTVISALIVRKMRASSKYRKS